jgi:hypothetical protein
MGRALIFINRLADAPPARRAAVSAAAPVVIGVAAVFALSIAPAVALADHEPHETNGGNAAVNRQRDQTGASSNAIAAACSSVSLSPSCSQVSTVAVECLAVARSHTRCCIGKGIERVGVSRVSLKYA